MEEKPHKIFPGFYIGSVEVATDLDMLFEYDITHIVTVASGIKPKWPKKFKYMALDVLDMENCNIKQHFQKTFEFIEKGRADGAVLVHCVAGISRSATVCAAYILKKLRVTLDDALGLVRDARPSICPNDGFLRQLKAYVGIEKELGYTTQEEEVPEPQKEEADTTITSSSLSTTSTTTTTPSTSEPTQQTTTTSPDSSSSSSTPSPLPSDSSSSSPSSSPSTNESFPSTQALGEALPHTITIPPHAKSRFCCRMCGTYLFNDTELVEHEPGNGQTSFDWRKRANSGQVECTSHFLEEPGQFGDTSELEGKLVCPKCSSRFGSWQWAGAQCSCGVWVTPAFQVPKTRVDAKPIMGK